MMSAEMAMPDNDSLIRQFLSYLQTQRQLSPLTLENYQRDLFQLIHETDHAPLATLNTLQIRKVVSTMHAHNAHARTISRKLSAWRSFYQWMTEYHHLARHPIQGIKAPRRAQVLPKALSVDDAIRLVSAPSDPKQNEASALCNRAMFELLYSSGLRVSELASLDKMYVSEAGYESPSWLHVTEQEVIVTGKGNKKRVVPVGKAALDALTAWLEARATLRIASGNHQHALFLNQQGRRMTPRMIQLRLKAHAQALNLPVHVHPHVLRHSFASHVLQSSGDLRAVQDMLGHVSIASTQVYTALDFQHLAKIYDAAHPRAKLK